MRYTGVRYSLHIIANKLFFVLQTCQMRANLKPRGFLYNYLCFHLQRSTCHTHAPWGANYFSSVREGRGGGLLPRFIAINMHHQSSTPSSTRLEFFPSLEACVNHTCCVVMGCVWMERDTGQLNGVLWWQRGTLVKEINSLNPSQTGWF